MVDARAAEARLRDAPWRQDADLQAILAVLGGAEKQTRIVGGVVRDTLLARGRQGTDIDLATALWPDEVIDRARTAGIAVYPTGIEHGTVTLKHGALTTEVTTLREDVETDGRHAVVRFGTDWARDAARRDFTLNALYADADGTLFDPLGGLADCLAQVVRFIGDADQRIAEDRLRVFRFFRFSASHGEQRFDADGLAACRRAAGDLGKLSAERVGAEMTRMLALPQVARTLTEMQAMGLFNFPEPVLERLRRYETHAPSLRGRLALLGEPAGLQARWRLSNALTEGVTRVRAGAEMLLAADAADKSPDEAGYRFADVIHDSVEVAIALHDADGAWASRLRAHRFAPPKPFPVSGADLLNRGFAAGPALGRELARLESIWIESGFVLDREDLLEQARI
jgi:poly(A) polymerase